MRPGRSAGGAEPRAHSLDLAHQRPASASGCNKSAICNGVAYFSQPQESFPQVMRKDTPTNHQPRHEQRSALPWEPSNGVSSYYVARVPVASSPMRSLHHQGDTGERR
jgi:hypothetical protein